MSKNWTNTADQLPPEGEWVTTISSGGQEVELKRQGNLWFMDNGMYVYYTPEKWRAL